MSAYGGFGRETNRFLTTLITKVSEKQDMHTSIVANYVRTKLSFEVVKSQVLCIRGSRKMKKPFVDVGEVEVVQHVAGIREWPTNNNNNNNNNIHNLHNELSGGMDTGRRKVYPQEWRTRTQTKRSCNCNVAVQICKLFTLSNTSYYHLAILQIIEANWNFENCPFKTQYCLNHWYKRRYISDILNR